MLFYKFLIDEHGFGAIFLYYPWIISLHDIHCLLEIYSATETFV